ncbi:MAG: L-threonylcarbamoyladenylate synthase [Deinococcota bacterium]|nr:L-threonylcarbamoyladenylate synthase [Deinococcota bacterium]
MAAQRLTQAVETLRSGGLVAFPTETVYGLGADALNPAAVAKVFAAKGRPADHPLIVHLAASSALPDWAVDVPDEAYGLAGRFWPGPLTLILTRHPRVPGAVTGGQATVGLRVPAHPVAQRLLEAFGSGVAAPSANRFGKLSPTTAAHVRAEFGGGVFVLDGGPCEVGLESTIVDLSGAAPRLLRPGGVSLSALEAVLGRSVSVKGENAPRAPGTLASHYAPATPVRLLAAEGFEERLRSLAAGNSVAVLARRGRPADARVTSWLELPDEPAAYGRGLYAALRELDAVGADLIAVEAVPEGEPWEAARDRLLRAAQSALEEEK